MAEDIKKELDDEAVDTENTVDETTKPEDAATDAQADEKDAAGEKAGDKEAEADSAEKDGKKIFGKKDKKKDKAQEKIEELEDKVKRQLAEFENFRNRSEKEKTAMFETGARSVIEKMLPVIDNFERGLAMKKKKKKDTPFADGMNGLGVKPIEAVGKEFDPNLHNAVMQVESDEYESGVIAQELQKGYTYHDTVVRHSMVAVVQ